VRHLSLKSVKQTFDISAYPSIEHLMESFALMCNDAIRIGLDNDSGPSSPAPSLKQLCKLVYGELKRYDDVLSYYKLCAISKAAGILAARKKSIKRGFPTKMPYLSKQLLVSCYGFKIAEGSLLLPVGNRKFEKIPLKTHTISIISQPGVSVRSFTLTEDALSLCIAKEMDIRGINEPQGFIGVDRNLMNITAGNAERVTYYDTSKAAEIAANTRRILRSLRRDDARIRKKIASKYGKRKKERTRHMIHCISKQIVAEAKMNRQAIVFEDIKGIRKLFRQGNGQGREFRAKMNSAPWNELKRQVEYKAAWDGQVQVITLTKTETRGTSMDCPRCGERLQADTSRRGEEHYRQLWCNKCGRWSDRDVVAVMNISERGRLKFDRSLRNKGEAGEAMKGNPQEEGSSRQEPVILRVDASKVHLQKMR